MLHDILEDVVKLASNFKCWCSNTEMVALFRQITHIGSLWAVTINLCTTPLACMHWHFDYRLCCVHCCLWWYHGTIQHLQQGFIDIMPLVKCFWLFGRRGLGPIPILLFQHQFWCHFHHNPPMQGVTLCKYPEILIHCKFPSWEKIWLFKTWQVYRLYKKYKVCTKSNAAGLSDPISSKPLAVCTNA